MRHSGFEWFEDAEPTKLTSLKNVRIIQLNSGPKLIYNRAQLSHIILTDGRPLLKQNTRMAILNRNLRITMFAFKKDEISEEQFHNHWSKVHAPIVAEFLAKAGVIKYTQVSSLSYTVRTLTIR